MEEEADNFTDLQKQIEMQLERDGAKRRPYSRMGKKENKSLERGMIVTVLSNFWTFKY